MSGKVLSDPTSIRIAGEPVELLAERAVHWPGARTLFVADVHLGKAGLRQCCGAATFRVWRNCNAAPAVRRLNQAWTKRWMTGGKYRDWLAIGVQEAVFVAVFAPPCGA
jgi:hypothetical protein